MYLPVRAGSAASSGKLSGFGWDTVLLVPSSPKILPLESLAGAPAIEGLGDLGRFEGLIDYFAWEKSD